MNYIHLYKGEDYTTIKIITDDERLKFVLKNYIMLKDKLALEKGWEFSYSTKSELSFQFRNDEFIGIDLFRQVNDIVFN